MTRGDLRDKLARMLDTSTSDPRPWTKAQLDQVIKEAHETVIELTQAIERHVLVPLRAGQVWYRLSSLSDDILAPIRLSDPINEWRLTAVTLSSMDEGRDRWEGTTGDPRFWVSPGFDWIGFWPHSDVDGGFLRLDYAAWPQDALGDVVSLEVDEEDEDRILDLAFALAQAWQWDEERALVKAMEFSEGMSLPKFRAQARTELVRMRGDRIVSGHPLQGQQ